MIPLSFLEYLKALKYKMLLLSFLSLSIILLLIFQPLGTRLYIFAIVFIIIYVSAVWSEFREYQNQLSSIKKSGLENYLLKLKLETFQTFHNGWGHSIFMTGTFKEYPIQLDIKSEKGILGNKYFITVSTSINNHGDNKIFNDQHSTLFKQGIYLFKNFATHSQEISLAKDCTVELEEVVTDLIVKLNFNGINPYKA